MATQIQALPPTPSRNSAPDTFSDDADLFLGALPTFRDQANALALEVEGFASVAEDSITASALSADEAEAAAVDAEASAIVAAAAAASAVNAPGTNGTSTTSLTIGTGSKTFTTQTAKSFVLGQAVIVSYTTTPTNYMLGQITAYNSGTGSMTVSVTQTGGSGTYAAWTIGLSAPSSIGARSVSDSSASSAFTVTQNSTGNILELYTGATKAVEVDASGKAAILGETSTAALTVHGGVRASSGAVHATDATDGFTFVSDPNTGIHNPTANILTLSTNGVAAIQINANQQVDILGPVTGTVTTVASTVIDCSLGNFYKKTISGNTSFTFSNVPSGKAYSIVFDLTVTSGTVTWPGSVIPPNSGTFPVLTVGKRHLIGFITSNGGTSWSLVSSTNYNS